MKKIIIFLFAVIIIAMAIMFLNNKKIKYLEQYAQDFKEACERDSACPIKPEGWVKFDKNSFYDPDSEYPVAYQSVNNGKEFKLRWKVATDTTLVAHGGIRVDVTVKKVSD